MTDTHTQQEQEQMRKVFFDAWRKHREQTFVEPLEAMIIEIILLHPEYHEMFDHPENEPPIEFEGTNPFLHLSLHLALREQISTDRPKGIKMIYDNLSKKFQDKHVAEHQMLECLGQILWDAQQSGKMPNEHYYLELLAKI